MYRKKPPPSPSTGKKNKFWLPANACQSLPFTGKPRISPSMCLILRLGGRSRRHDTGTAWRNLDRYAKSQASCRKHARKRGSPFLKDQNTDQDPLYHKRYQQNHQAYSLVITTHRSVPRETAPDYPTRCTTPAKHLVSWRS